MDLRTNERTDEQTNKLIFHLANKKNIVSCYGLVPPGSSVPGISFYFLIIIVIAQWFFVLLRFLGLGGPFKNTVISTQAESRRWRIQLNGFINVIDRANR